MALLLPRDALIRHHLWRLHLHTLCPPPPSVTAARAAGHCGEERGVRVVEFARASSMRTYIYKWYADKYCNTCGKERGERVVDFARMLRSKLGAVVNLCTCGEERGERVVEFARLLRVKVREERQQSVINH
jgi:hypothetical protein